MEREQKANAQSPAPVQPNWRPKVYAGCYTRCDHCGIYDSDSTWCTLCQRPKGPTRGA